MGTYRYDVGDVPCYGQLTLPDDIRDVVATTGSGILSMMGYQDYLRAWPPSSNRCIEASPSPSSSMTFW